LENKEIDSLYVSQNQEQNDKSGPIKKKIKKGRSEKNLKKGGRKLRTSATNKTINQMFD
jgi:hypothetical protein